MQPLPLFPAKCKIGKFAAHPTLTLRRATKERGVIYINIMKDFGEPRLHRAFYFLQVKSSKHSFYLRHSGRCRYVCTFVSLPALRSIQFYAVRGDFVTDFCPQKSVFDSFYLKSAASFLNFYAPKRYKLITIRSQIRQTVKRRILGARCN